MRAFRPSRSQASSSVKTSILDSPTSKFASPARNALSSSSATAHLPDHALGNRMLLLKPIFGLAHLVSMPFRGRGGRAKASSVRNAKQFLQEWRPQTAIFIGPRCRMARMSWQKHYRHIFTCFDIDLLHCDTLTKSSFKWRPPPLGALISSYS